MATKTFKTRIQLKYDSYANWTANNPTPLSGELCVVVVPAAAGAVAQEPAVLFKVGDGVTAFNALPWGSGLAADVHDWAKAAAKPAYTADEIEGLANYISGKVQDTDTQYKLEQDTTDTHILKLYSKGLDDADWTVVATITTADTVYDDTALAGRVTNVESRATALEDLVGSTKVATQIANAIAALDLANTYDAKGAANTAETNAKTYADGLIAGLDVTDTPIDGQYVESVSEVDGKVVVSRKALPDYSEVYDAKGAAADVQTNLDAEVTRAQAAEQTNADAIAAEATRAKAAEATNASAAAAAQTQADKGVADAAAAKTAADAAQSDVDALEEKVGTVEDGKTVVEMIADAKTAATYDDTEVRGLIGDNADDIAELDGKVGTLIGSDAGKSARTIANEELAAQLIPESAQESLDTLGEIAAWIQSHPDDASAMNAAITALQAKVDTGDQTVTAYVNSAIDALNIGDYAKAAELTALAARVTTAEADIATLKTDVAKKANDADLAAIAKTGNVNDLAQTDGDYIIFDCGSSSEVI